MHDTDALVRDVLEAGARGFLLKSDASRFLISAVETLADHKPFFTGKVSEALLESFLLKKPIEGALTGRAPLSSWHGAVPASGDEGQSWSRYW